MRKKMIILAVAALGLTACGGGSGDLVLEDREFDRVPSLSGLKDGLKAPQDHPPYVPNPLASGPESPASAP